MLSAKLKSKVESLWDSFWSSGISNPLSVIEQISYLLFIKKIEDYDSYNIQINNSYTSIYERYIDGKKAFFGSCKWTNIKNMEENIRHENMIENVFPFLRTIGEKTKFAQYVKDANYLIKRPNLLSQAVAVVDEIDQNDIDVKGDLYEFLLSKLSTAGMNGQFRTPRHIIDMIVEMVEPTYEDTICDPACGTAGFLMSASIYIKNNSKVKSVTNTDRFKNDIFFGRDFDPTMLRIAAMNLLLHGVENPDIAYSDTLSDEFIEANKYSIILANPPFKGSIDVSDVSNTLKDIASTKRAELLFLLLIERLLIEGGRCAVIVPDGVLFGTSVAHKKIRKRLVDSNQLKGIISMPSGIFKPYAGVSTSIIVFNKGGVTDKVWYYDMQADGYSLDDKRHEVPENDIDDILISWKNCVNNSSLLPRQDDKWFWVSADRIRANEYDLSIKLYKDIEEKIIKYPPANKILSKISELNDLIQMEFDELKELINYE